MKKRFLFMIPLIFLLFIPTALGSSVQKHTPVDIPFDSYKVVVPAGKTGTFKLKTKSGSTKFTPVEAKGKLLDGFEFYIDGGLKYDSGDYLKVTTSDGAVMKIQYAVNKWGNPFYFGKSFGNHESKWISVELVLANSSKARTVYLYTVYYLPS